MNITIFADASFCGKTNTGGWGSWVKKNGWEFGRASGGRMDWVESTNTAELAAVYYAVQSVTLALGDVRNVSIQIDNTSIIAMMVNVLGYGLHRETRESGVIIGKTNRVTQDQLRLLEKIKDLLDGKAVSIKHIKGHKHYGKTSRHSVNNQCDWIAKQHMMAARARTQKRKPPIGHTGLINHIAGERLLTTHVDADI